VKNPSNGHSGLAEVKALAHRVKQAGMKVWLTVHYSDTWQTLSADYARGMEKFVFSDLQVAVSNYTATILTEISPDIIQIGNEINSGMLGHKGI
jgi:arabinogalactan endo-1,4-beta-galactosidase